jgi:type II secretory pathway pseudopilin PulG
MVAIIGTGDMKFDPQGRVFCEGFTYLGLLIIIALMTSALAGAGTLWSFEVHRAKEKQLLIVGNEIRRAIGLYYEHSPGVVKQYPPTLEALRKDDRYEATQRYLRQIYLDPMTDRPNWGFVMAPSGGVMGVYSLSDKSTLKRAHFKETDRVFENKQDYQSWAFVYAPMNVNNGSSMSK